MTALKRYMEKYLITEIFSHGIVAESFSRSATIRGKVEVGKSKILVVDDEKLITYSLSTYLAGKDFDVRWTESSSEALSLIRAETFDIVISDIFMMPINGIELIRELRKLDRNCKVIMMSATVERAKMEEQMAELDVSAFLEKPFDLDSLLKMLREMTNEVR